MEQSRWVKPFYIFDVRFVLVVHMGNGLTKTHKGVIKRFWQFVLLFIGQNFMNIKWKSRPHKPEQTSAFFNGWYAGAGDLLLHLAKILGIASFHFSFLLTLSLQKLFFRNFILFCVVCLMVNLIHAFNYNWYMNK